MTERGSDTDIIEGVLWDEHSLVSLTEVCSHCGVQTEVVREMVTYGIIEPLGDDDSQWRFTGTSLRRVTTVIRLQRDLGVNLAGAALALDLMDELAEYRRRTG